jgi:hypothetical protein
MRKAGIPAIHPLQVVRRYFFICVHEVFWTSEKAWVIPRPAMPDFSDDIRLYTFSIYYQLETPEARS